MTFRPPTEEELKRACEQGWDGISGVYEPSMKGDFEGIQGTFLIYPPHLEKKEGKRKITDGIEIREGEWTTIGITWSADKATLYVHGTKRPWWAKGILYRWWYRGLMNRWNYN